MRFYAPWTLALCAGLGLGGCNLAPEYQRPAMATPEAFKEAAGAGSEIAKAADKKPAPGEPQWFSSDPADLRPRGPWWSVFKDQTLDGLEARVRPGNQDVAAALATMDQARAFAARSMAGLSPAVNMGGQISANKQSTHRPMRTSNDLPTSTDYVRDALSHGLPINEPDHYGDNQLGLQASYEIDLWGRVRNIAAAGATQAEASEADLAAIELSIEAELARDYVALEGLDAEIALLRDIAASYAGTLDLTRKRVNGGIASPADESRARAQLEFVKAQIPDLQERRALLEHAIATLVGTSASGFSLPAKGRFVASPRIPLGAPSQLLERRPDIAAAERRVASANRTIGVARAAFFPRFTINLSGGTQDTGISLFNWRNSVWSLGPTMTLPIFDGGLHAADLRAAEAAYLQAVAQYRGQVLRAIQEVEDALAQINYLAREAKEIAAAVAATGKTLDIAIKLYTEGAVNYIEVETAQSDSLQARRQAVTLNTRRVQASLALIVAFGGGWSSPEFTPVEPEQPCSVCELATAAVDARVVPDIPAQVGATP
ncbi:MAG: efflux transporter outer membrane subunit [Methylocystis sp.]